MKIIRRPYHLLLLTALILVVVSFFVLERSISVIIHVQDSYYVIAYLHIYWVLAILLFFEWILYALTTRAVYSMLLSRIHILITIVCCLSLAILLYYVDDASGPTARRYFDFGSWVSFENFTGLMKVFAIVLLVLIIVQILFVVNVMVGIFRKLSNRTIQ